MLFLGMLVKATGVFDLKCVFLVPRRLCEMCRLPTPSMPFSRLGEHRSELGAQRGFVKLVAVPARQDHRT